LREWYQSANQKSGGRLDILKNALGTFSDTRAPQAAASLAYYAFFSLFPLLLVLIAAGSYFLDSQQVFQDVTRFMQAVIPVSTQVIEENLQEVLDARGTVGIVGLLTLLWSALGVFTNLEDNITLAWKAAPRRNYLEKRLVGLGMIATLGGLLILSLSLDWINNLIPFLNLPSVFSPALSQWRLASSLASWLMIFILFLALYRWVPNTKVHRNASLFGALVASVAWKIATSGFGWYMNSGLSRYSLIYGSLGTIVALLFLIFLLSVIALFGAHLCAAIDRWLKERKSGRNGFHYSG